MTRRSRGGYRRGKYWYFKYKKPNGSWAEHATGSTNHQEGHSIHAAFLRDLEDGRLPNERGKWTLEQATARWCEDRELRVARGTFLSERTIIRNLLRVFGKGITLQKLADLDEIRRYESARLREGASAKTVNNEVQVIAGILRSVSLWHRVSGLYKPLKAPKSDVGAALTSDEAHRLLQAAMTAEPNAVAPYVAVASYATGMRRGEIANLQIGSIHIDQAHPSLYVKRSTTKSDRGARYVALDRMAGWAFRKLLFRAKLLGAVAAGHFLCPTKGEKHTRETDPLYGAQGYDPTHPQSSWAKEWNRLRKRVGIEHRRFHDLRHSYISRAAEAGVPLAVTQAQVGHMSTQMVEHYTHICHGAIHHAAEQIEKNSFDLLAHLGLSTGCGEMPSPTAATIQPDIPSPTVGPSTIGETGGTKL
jgi:integrase